MSNIFKIIFYLAVFPGLLFAAAMGLFFSWVDRKVTARIQWRVGPPWYQPLADLVKLLGKETIVPAGSRQTGFLLAPLVGLAGAGLVAAIVGLAVLDPRKSFVGDLVAVVYLLLFPALAVILGGSLSRNPLASLGASREIKLLIGYELPFWLALAVIIIKTGSFQLGAIAAEQAQGGMAIASLSGILAFIVFLFCLQAKLTACPFDIPEAETEIIAGPYVEYSGPALAVYKLTKAILLFILPLLMAFLFLGPLGLGSLSAVLWTLLKIVIILVLVILIRNTNPRLRVDQAMKFFWGPLTVLAALAVILALFGM